MKIIEKSVKIAESLFPEIYDTKKKYRTFHFSFAWKKNRLISIGINNPFNVSSKAFKFAQIFGTKKQLKYPYLHAEIDMISRMWGKTRVDGNIKVVVLRLNKNGKLKETRNYNNGKRDGPWEEFDTNGQLEYRGTYKNGKPYSIYEEWEKRRSLGEFS